MTAAELVSDILKGNRSIGQTQNLIRYLLSDKKEIVDWDPIYISIFLTYNCNLKCNMCLTHSTKFSNSFGQKPTNDVDLGLFKHILDRYRNAIGVRLIGNGEPLLNKDLFDMIEYAASTRKMDVSSGSNGILLGKYIEQILNSKLKYFDISINGHNPKEFNRMTGMSKDYFEKICSNTIALVKKRNALNSKLKIAVSIILDKVNYKYLIDMIYFADTLGVDNINFFHFLPVDEEGFTAEERCLFADDPDVLKAFSEVESLPKNIRDKVTLPPLLDQTMSSNKFCSVWFYNISVDGNENVGGCCCQILDLSKFGKLYEGDAWNNQCFQEMRKKFMYPERPLLKPCTWCYQNSSNVHNLILGKNFIISTLRKVYKIIHINI